MKRSLALTLIILTLVIIAGAILHAVRRPPALPVTSPSQTQRVIFPAGGEQLVEGQTYTITWTPEGRSETQIFLIDTALQSVGASVSSVDRVYHIPDNGSFHYTVPKNISPGTYIFEVGTFTSGRFTIVSPQ